MWIVFASGAALFAGATAVLAKEGIRTTDSTVATALRTLVVLAGAWGMVLIVGSQRGLAISTPVARCCWCSPAWPRAPRGCATSGPFSWAA